MKSLFMKTLVIGLAMACAANAATVSYSGSVVKQTTDWTDTVSIQKFDPALGTLNSIAFELTGKVEGNVGYENLSPTASTIKMKLAALIVLQRPDTSDIWFVAPNDTVSESSSGFDQLADLDGDSGSKFYGLAGRKTSSTVSATAADIALFTGTTATDTIDLTVDATSASSGSGSGNLLLWFQTDAAADVKVTYDYTVPEPTTIGLLAVGGMLFIKRRRA
ncbi:MAG: PEP-CTERM sorting domain-containing protein [Phycisphaerae bacterium]|nr:PEP-CTERM sorting domain-containing protein [Phycisphaerae bacterium]